MGGLICQFLRHSNHPLMTGCATAKSSKLGTAPPEVTTVFRDLTEASGRDSTSVIVSERRSPTINAASAGGSRFIVTSGLVETGNRCLLIGVAAHELAHDRSATSRRLAPLKRV